MISHKPFRGDRPARPVGDGTTTALDTQIAGPPGGTLDAFKMRAAQRDPSVPNKPRRTVFGDLSGPDRMPAQANLKAQQRAMKKFRRKRRRVVDDDSTLATEQSSGADYETVFGAPPAPETPRASKRAVRNDAHRIFNGYPSSRRPSRPTPQAPRGRRTGSRRACW